MEFTLSLAVLDFVPVLLTGIGFMYIIRMVFSILPAHGRIALLGGLLVVAGGLFRATWKLIMALSHGAVDVNWMENGLFVLMAPGYVMFAWSVWQVSRSVQGKKILNAWLVPVLISLLTLGISFYFYSSVPDSPSWKRLLLTMTVLANFISGILLITFAFRQKLSKAGWLFVVNLVGIFVLNGLARMPEQSILLHWIDEGINTASWLAFAVAAWMVYRYARINFEVDAFASTRQVSSNGL